MDGHHNYTLTPEGLIKKAELASVFFFRKNDDRIQHLMGRNRGIKERD